MSKTVILYKDVAPGAAEDALVSAEGASAFSATDILPEDKEVGSPIITGEPGLWGLTGDYVPMDGQSIAFWSSEMSDGECVFAAAPHISVVFDKQYSSTGVTLVFDPATEDYCGRISVAWYHGDTLLYDGEFFPDSATYFCAQTVEAYDRVKITLHETRLPYRYAKLQQIIFGIYRSFDMTEIRSASITHEMDGISEELPVAQMSWTLDSKRDTDFLFQMKQPVEVRNDNRLLGVYYVDSSERVSKSVYNVECYDAFGVLDESSFVGGVYKDYSAAQLLADIVGEDFTLDIQVEDALLSGMLEACTKREAMQQVLFAWMVCASTDGTAKIRVFSPDGEAEEIGEDKTFTGVSVSTEAIITSVRVTAHTYTEDESGNLEIGGAKYADTTEEFVVENPNVTANDKKKVVEVTDATLVSPAIGQQIAQRVYDYHMRRSTNSSSFVWSGQRLGDLLRQPTPWGTTTEGHLMKMAVKLSNTVVVDGESKGV